MVADRGLLDRPAQDRFADGAADGASGSEVDAAQASSSRRAHPAYAIADAIMPARAAATVVARRCEG